MVEARRPLSYFTDLFLRQASPQVLLLLPGSSSDGVQDVCGHADGFEFCLLLSFLGAPTLQVVDAFEARGCHVKLDQR